MSGHNLMQAISRVNRVFKDKPGGLVVDYLGLAHELRAAMETYTESGGAGYTTLDQDRAVANMQEKYEICCDLLSGFDWSQWTTGGVQALALLPSAQEYILAQEDGKERYLQAVRDLSRAFALAVPHEQALQIRDDIAFFQAAQSALTKRAASQARLQEELDLAVRQIVSRAVTSDKVIDIFASAGLNRPDVSVLSDEFLIEVQGMSQRNLAADILERLLKDEIAARRQRNVVQANSFADMLQNSIRRYHNRTIETAQVIEEHIQLAKALRQADARGEQLGLNEDALAFYDALAANESAVEVLGDKQLRAIARELAAIVWGNITIDWTLRENARADLRRLVRRTLRKHKYPPGRQGATVSTIIEQAESFSEVWLA